MLKVILDIIQNPNLLAQSALIKKSFIRKVILLLSVIVTIPIVINHLELTQHVKQDFAVITQHLPKFKTVNTVITGESDHQSNHALQTETSYLLYDIEDSVPQSTKDDLAQNHLFTFFITKTQYSLFTNGIQLMTLSTHDDTISTQTVANNIQMLTHVISIAVWLTPILSLIITVATILFYNMFYTISARLLFLINNKIVHWVHLWRVSLLASIVPYVILSLLSLFRIEIPFKQLIILLYTLVIQWQVLKSIE